MSGLWRDHPLTQQELIDGKRKTQAELLIQLFREAQDNRTPLALPTIMRAGIAQHGARMKELPNRGFVIENEMTRVDGVIHSVYRLIYDPERSAAAVQP